MAYVSRMFLKPEGNNSNMPAATLGTRAARAEEAITAATQGTMTAAATARHGSGHAARQGSYQTANRGGCRLEREKMFSCTYHICRLRVLNFCSSVMRFHLLQYYYRCVLSLG